MRKKIVCATYILGLTFCSLSFLSSCKDDVIPLPELEVGKGAVEFDGKTFVQTIEVKSDKAWSASIGSNTPWLKYKLVEGGIQLVAEPNDSEFERMAQVSITALGGDKVVKAVKQKTVATRLAISSLSPESWVNHHETEFTFTIYADSPWKLVTDSNWASADYSQGKPGVYHIKVTFNANPTDLTREAQFVLSTKEKTIAQIIRQRGVKEFEDVTHCFYLHRGTFPVLYSGMLMLDYTQDSWLIDERNTLVGSELPNNVELIDLDGFPNNFLDRIRQINKENPDAVFGYYADDYRIHYAIPLFTRLGIDSSRVKIKILPDGTATYLSLFNKPYGQAGIGEKNYKEKQASLEVYISERMANPSISYAETLDMKNGEIDFDIPHVLSGYPNVQYYIQDKSYLITEDPYVKEQMEKNNYVVKQPRELLQNLSTEKQNQFYRMTNFDKAKYDILLDASSKPNLIILGTNTNINTTGAITPQQQYNYVKTIVDKYSGEYDIFYKAHPADEAYKTYEEDFKAQGLKFIEPAKMPFDVFTWALDDKIHALGGFNSTVFLSVPLDKVKFMFAKDASALGIPFYNLFKDRDDIYWVQQ